MNKKTMWILFIIATVFLVLGGIAYAGSFAYLFATAPSVSDDGTYRHIVDNSWAIGLLLAVCLLGIGSIIELVGRIGMLIAQAKRQQWAWFVCTLIFGWLCMLIYLLAVPETPIYRPIPGYQPVPGYQPQYQPVGDYQPQIAGYPPQYQSSPGYQPQPQYQAPSSEPVPHEEMQQYQYNEITKGPQYRRYNQD